MRHAPLWLLVSILAAGLFLMVGACRDNNDDDEDLGAAPTPPPGGCDANQAPALTDGAFVVADELIGATATFAEAESVEVYLTFDDPDCNLGGGDILYRVDADTDAVSRTIPTDTPCTGVADSRVLGFSFSALGVGDHTLHVSIADHCGGVSDEISLAFTLTEYEPPTDDDTAGDDDDTTTEPTLLTGEISLVDDATDYAGRPVRLFLFNHWLPEGVGPAGFTIITVPAEGFPFTYEWNLDEDGVVSGDYYAFAYLDEVAGDGIFNQDLDPVHSPYLPTTIALGETTKADLTLVPPAD